MKKHNEKLSKVNALIDEGILPLVLALNEFDCILTVDSCQGDEENPAYVYFKYAEQAENESSFYYHFAKMLNEHAQTKCEYEFRLSWMSGNSEAMAEILTSPRHVKQLAYSIATVANEHRKSGFGDDR